MFFSFLQERNIKGTCFELDLKTDIKMLYYGDTFFFT